MKTKKMSCLNNMVKAIFVIELMRFIMDEMRYMKQFKNMAMNKMQKMKKTLSRKMTGENGA